MFDQFKQMGALAGLLRNRDKLEAAARRVESALLELRCTGESGGGAVRAIVDGHCKVRDIHLEPALVATLTGDDARTHAQDLIAEAVNDGVAKAQAAAKEIVRREAEELGLGDVAEQLAGGPGGPFSGLGKMLS